MANRGEWAPGTMRDGIRKILRVRESKAAGRDVFAYKVPYRDGNGVQTSETFSSLTQAKKFRDLVRSQKHAGLLEDFKAGAVPVSSWAADWIESLRTVKRESTWTSYESLLRINVIPALGGMAVRAVTPMDIQRAVNEWSRDLAPKTVHLAYRVCGNLFRAAVTSGLRRSSPCVGISLPELPDYEVIPFTVEEVDALTQAIHPNYRMLIRVAAQTGLRIGELRGLTWDRVDLEARTITVNRQLQDGEFRPVKSKASKRVVPISKALASELAIYRWENPPRALSVPVKGGEPVMAELVFLTVRGRPIGTSTLKGYWKKACAEVGISPERARFHNLRHFFASILIDRNQNALKIQKWMGHANVSVTLNVYGHLMPGSDDDLRSVMDDVFGSGLLGATPD